MATAIFFAGRRINIPGAYSKIDASALASVAPAAVGIVALIGTAEGGKPLTIDSEDADATRSEKLIERYRSGDLRTAGSFAFEPSTDDAIPGGAQRLVCVKVNPATQSAVTLPDSLAADSVVVTSRDYGLFTAQINLEVETGTLTGKKITVVFEDESEVFDDVGGEAIFTVRYDPGTNGWDIITGQVSSSQFVAAASRSDLGLVAERTADIAAPGTLQYVSSNAGDVTQQVTVYGLSGTTPVKETVTLNGVTIVNGTQSFSKVLGCIKSAATVGTVTVQSTVPTTLFTLAPATLTRGVQVPTASPAGGVLTVTIDTPAAADVVVVGTNAAGAAIMERWDMTAGGGAGATAFASLAVICLGDVAGARTITIANSITTSHSVYTTVQKVIDRLNALAGFTAAAVVSNPTTFLMTDMDYLSAVTILSVTTSFYANNFAFVSALNEGSAYVSAARATGATREPANTSAAVFLVGGVEGSPSITEWQTAFTLLKRRRVNQIVPLTRDPAVHALLASHLVLRAGSLRSEANGYIGIGTAGGAGETKANIKTQIRALATRHIAAISQECQRYDPITGESTWYPPHYFAAIAAGMQAGSSVGEPLTHKRPMVTDIRQDSSWTVEDDTEEMIDSGLMLAEKRDNEGIRWVRSITTHLADDNVVFGEVSANAAANEAVFRLRRQLELKVGKKGLVGSVAALKSIANDELERLIKDEIIVAFRSLQVEQIGDVFPISVELAPVLPINFIPVTVHLVAMRAAA